MKCYRVEYKNPKLATAKDQAAAHLLISCGEKPFLVVYVNTDDGMEAVAGYCPGIVSIELIGDGIAL